MIQKRKIKGKSREEEEKKRKEKKQMTAEERVCTPESPLISRFSVGRSGGRGKLALSDASNNSQAQFDGWHTLTSPGRCGVKKKKKKVGKKNRTKKFGNGGKTALEIEVLVSTE